MMKQDETTTRKLKGRIDQEYSEFENKMENLRKSIQAFNIHIGHKVGILKRFYIIHFFFLRPNFSFLKDIYYQSKKTFFLVFYLNKLGCRY